MTPVISLFAYIQHDEIAVQEQNQLRKEFIRVEKDIQDLKPGENVSVALGAFRKHVSDDYPANLYKENALNALRSSIEFLAINERDDALVSLDIAYGLCGKFIRLSRISRINAEVSQ